MTNVMLVMGIFSLLFRDINHNYLDYQINISVSNFIGDYEDYQEKHYFNGEKSEDIAKKLNKHFLLKIGCIVHIFNIVKYNRIHSILIFFVCFQE